MKILRSSIQDFAREKKLYEELLMAEEGLRKTAHEKIFIGKPLEFDQENF